MTRTETTDVVLVGAGIMSATLGVLLKEVEPTWNITILERLDEAAQESSGPWNNAGTGHSALCELNYAPAAADGSVDPTKAIGINEQFQISRQLWASLVDEGKLPNAEFINPVPHMSLVFGEAHSDYMSQRYKALSSQKLFERMQYSEDRDQIAQWAPLTMNGRGEGRVAATYSPEGTDVDFGSLTKHMVNYLQARGASVEYGQHVTSVTKESDGAWTIKVKNRLNSEHNKTIRTKFLFLGAGGGALSLLQESGIPEGKGFGGFPVSGLFLRNTNPETAKLHNAKVYGQASVGAPPMSVPHLDTRYVDGQRSLLFGPYAGFKTNFLKHGSLLDLPLSLRLDNIYPMLRAGLDNMSLTKYLITELLKNQEAHLASLHQYFPEANGNEWELITAGQRVQVMKKDAKRGGVLQFGTELVSGADGSIAALLGASPGASTAAPIMFKLLERCFPHKMNEWDSRLKELVPAYGVKLNENPDVADEVMSFTAKILGIHN